MNKKLLRFVVGLAIVLATAWGIRKTLDSVADPEEIRRQIASFASWEVGGILILSSAMMAVRAYRFRLLLEDADQEITFWQTLKVFITGQVFSPLPGGEGMRPVLLKKEAGIGIRESLTPTVVLGITEMLAAVVIALSGSLFLGILRMAAALSAVGLAGLFWVVVNRKAVAAVIDWLPDLPAVRKTGKEVARAQKEVKSSLFKKGSWRPSRLFLAEELLVLVTDLLGAGIIYVVARHFQLPLGYLLSLYVFAAAAVLGELVPFAPGGVGPTEGGMVGILVFSGISLSSSLAVVLLFRAATLLYGIAVGFVFLAIFYSGEYALKAKRLCEHGLHG